MTFSLRICIIAIALIITVAVGYGEMCYRNGWYAHSNKVNTDFVLKKQKAGAKLLPAEQKAATASAESKVIYRTITRNVVKYAQDPNRTVCHFDDAAVRLRQQSIDAANNISGFDEPAMQTQPSGK